MQHLREPYYVALLTAAAYHGGGLSNVATVLVELVAEMAPRALEIEARRVPMTALMPSIRCLPMEIPSL